MKEVREAGIALQVLRKAAGLTVRELAAEAAASPSYLSRVENGQVAPTSRWVHDVVAAAGRLLAKDAA